MVGGEPVETLPDLPPAPNGLLFVDEAPSLISLAAGHHAQDRAGRVLWSRLIRAGLLPQGTIVETADDSLVAMGHGFAVMDPRPRSTDRSDEVGPGDAVDSRGPTDAELTAAVGPLWQRIALWRPAAIVFVSARAARAAAGRPLPVPWGVLDSVALAGRPCLLLPPEDAAQESERVAIDLLRNLLSVLPR